MPAGWEIGPRVWSAARGNIEDELEAFGGINSRVAVSLDGS